MDLGLSVKKRLLPLILHNRKRHGFERKTQSLSMESIGFDSILNVVSFLNEDSRYSLSHANHLFDLILFLSISYNKCVSHYSNWNHCFIHLQQVSFPILVSLFQKYGALVSTLEIRGSASLCDRERLFYAIKKYCVNLEVLDAFGVPYVIALSSKISSFSISFPSCVSDYSSSNALNERFSMYSDRDSISQSMEIHNQDLSAFKHSIWQVAIENHILNGYSGSFQCCINGHPCGSFSLMDSTVTEQYKINLLFPIPEDSLSLEYCKLTLSICCTSSLPFGAGYVTISKVGRVTFIKDLNSVMNVKTDVPPFVNPSL